MVARCSVVSDSSRPTGGSPPGSSVRGILQAGTLEWVAIPFPGDFLNLGVIPASPALADGFFTVEPPGKIYISYPYTHKYTHIYIHTYILQIILPFKMEEIWSHLTLMGKGDRERG